MRSERGRRQWSYFNTTCWTYITEKNGLIDVKEDNTNSEMWLRYGKVSISVTEIDIIPSSVVEKYTIEKYEIEIDHN